MSFVSCLSAKLRASFFRSSPRPISASQLHASLHFHPWSIHLVVFKGSYFSFRMGDLVLGPASCLDAFSSYPFPAWLPSSTIGMITGAPAAGPSRSASCASATYPSSTPSRIPASPVRSLCVSLYGYRSSVS